MIAVTGPGRHARSHERGERGGRNRCVELVGDELQRFAHGKREVSLGDAMGEALPVELRPLRAQGEGRVGDPAWRRCPAGAEGVEQHEEEQVVGARRQRGVPGHVEAARRRPEPRVVATAVARDPGDVTPVQVDLPVGVVHAHDLVDHLLAVRQRIRHGHLRLRRPPGGAEHVDGVGRPPGLDQHVDVGHGAEPDLGIALQRERHALQQHRRDPGRVERVERRADRVEQDQVVVPRSSHDTLEAREVLVVDTRVDQRAVQEREHPHRVGFPKRVEVELLAQDLPVLLDVTPREQRDAQDARVER